MKSMIVGMLAETSIHPGVGSSAGFVDLPVAREKVTNYPVIVGSSLKGSLLDRAREVHGTPKVTGEGNEKEEKIELPEDIENIFGRPDRAGEIMVSDARLLLLPVRSLTGQYRWVTCPYLLERFMRDITLAGFRTQPVPEIVGPNEGEAWGEDSGSIFLEEREFQVTDKATSKVAEQLAHLKKLIPHRPATDRIDRQLVLLHEDDFKWFASYGLPVVARNNLDETTKVSKNLWYEESLSQDTLMYMLLMERREGSITKVRKLLKTRPYLQVGGNETVGHGWFALKTWNGE
ncbi:MAG: type III-B CRISPR module RAMP protein Cmr4 [Methanothrix sp.]|nr:type III-B CRISPR module RAMP protein Cmr4 [Methanothrix sp.]